MRVKESVSAREPSETVSVIVALPFSSAFGVTDTVQFGAVPPKTIPVASTKLVFELIAVRAVPQVREDSGSSIITARDVILPSSETLWFKTFDIVGASFVAETLRERVSVATSEPSETVSVMVALPF